MNRAVKGGRFQVSNVGGHLIVSLVAVGIFCANISVSGLWHPDAPSHALNGVFYRDMAREGGVFEPVDYAERYYVQYPSLTVGMYPPVFYVVEGALYQVLGISGWVAKVSVLFFTLLGANAFYLLCREWFPVWLATIAGSLLLLQPASLFAQTNVMLEMPALSLSLCALYLLYVATDRSNRWASFSAPILSAMAFLAKQTSVFLCPIWLVWVAAPRRWGIIRVKALAWGVLVGLAMLGPWIVVNLTAGKQYLSAFAFQEYHVASNLTYYLTRFSDIVSLPVAVLTLCSILFASKFIKEEGYQFAALWLFSVLLFISMMEFTAPRYAIFAVPALIILGSYSVSLFAKQFKSQTVLGALVFLVVSFHAFPNPETASRDIRGFEAVTSFVLADPECRSVLYDGYFHSNFIFHMRSQDKERRMFVFRASKLVFTTKMIPEVGYRELIHDQEGFYEQLDRYSIKYVIQEQKDSMRTDANTRIRQWLKSEKFKLVARFPAEGRNLENLGDFLVYEYTGHKEKPLQKIELDMPMLGRSIVVDLGDNRNH